MVIKVYHRGDRPTGLGQRYNKIRFRARKKYKKNDRMSNINLQEDYFCIDCFLYILRFSLYFIDRFLLY